MGNVSTPPARSRPWEEYLKEEDFVPPREADRIGSGGFAFVYKAKLGGVTVAAKELKLVRSFPSGSDVDFEKLYEAGNILSVLQREILVHATLEHPHIVKFLGVTGQWKGKVRIPKYILMEYVSGGMLLDVQIKPQEGDPKTLQRILKHLEGVACALDYLHSQRPPVLHRDIKPENVLLTPSGVVKLVDLGLAKEYKAGQADSTLIGTPPYLAPEVLYRSEKCTVKSDVFALGTTAFVLLGLNPGLRKCLEDWLAAALGIAEQLPVLGLGEKLYACINEEPSKRPTAGEIKEALCNHSKFREGFPQKRAALLTRLGADALVASRANFKLVLDNTRMTEDDTQTLIAVLEEWKGLQELRISDCQMGKVAFPMLVDMLPRFQQLQTISLTSSGPHKEWASHLVSVLPRLPRLEVLELQSNALGEDIVCGLVDCLQKLLQLNQLGLKHLNLSSNGIDKVKTVVSVIRSLPPGCKLTINDNNAQQAEEQRKRIEKEWTDGNPHRDRRLLVL